MHLSPIIKNFILPKQFEDEIYWTKLKVIVLNIMMPLSIISGCTLLYIGWEELFDGTKTLFQSWLDVAFVTSLVLFYLYFLLTKKLDTYLAVYTAANIIYFSAGYYFAIEAETTILWLFVFSLIIFFFNKLKYAIINFFLFYGLIIIISITRYEELNEQFYSTNSLMVFFLAFTVYSIVLLANEFFKQRIIHSHRLQQIELEEKNEALLKALTLQEKIYDELQKKEENEKETARDLLAIINNTSDLIWIVDENLKVKVYNKSYEESIKRRFGVDEIAESEDIEDIIKANRGDKLLDFVNKRYLQVIDAKKSITYSDKYERDGDKLHYVTEMSPITDEYGQVKGISSFSKNITDFIKIQKEKEELTQRNSSIIESIGEIVYEYSFIKDEFIWNEAIQSVLGLTLSEMPHNEEEFSLRIHKHNKEGYQKELNQAKNNKVNLIFELQFLSHTGYIWMQNRATLHYDSDGNIIRMIGVLSDISERKNNDTKKLTAVVQGVDLERKRIAAEIHDSLGQTLIAASLMLNSMNDIAKNNFTDKDYQRHELIGKMINEAIQESRILSHNLMPKSLEDYGIVPSLKSLINKINASEKTIVEFHTNLGEEQRIPIDVEINIYRVTQEALSNIIKHSQALKVIIQLLIFNNEVTYTIEDNGNGYNSNEANFKEGMGLKNIKNRVLSIGGIVQFDSHINYGTIITIEIDLKQKIFESNL